VPAEEAARLGRRAEVGRGGARPGFGAGGGGVGRALQATSASLLLPFFLSLRVRSQPHDTGERRSHPKATGGHEGKGWIPMFFISYLFCVPTFFLRFPRDPKGALLRHFSSNTRLCTYCRGGCQKNVRPHKVNTGGVNSTTCDPPLQCGYIDLNFWFVL